MRIASLALASIVSTLTLASGASSRGVTDRPAPIARAAFGPAALRFGRSLGSPTEGRLVGGLHLEEGPYLRIVPAYAAGDARWGLEPLVAMIDRAARSVRRRFPDAIVSVGQLSRAGGGDIDRHRSHESGRDADISFFVRTASGRELLPLHFVPFLADGTAPSWPGALFDDAKNWALVAAMVSDPEAHVTHIFIAAPLRARLLGYAERMGVPMAIRVRAAEAMQQPRGAQPHDDHFHVRIGCPPHMAGCIENPSVPSNRPPPGLSPHGRRGGLAQTHQTSIPILAPLPDPSGVVGGKPPSRGPDAREGDKAPWPPAAPPASMTVPIDDVDG